MAQLVERYVRNVQATSSNLVISTSQNLKRTPFVRTVLGFFLYLFRLILCRFKPSKSRYRLLSYIQAVYAAKAA